MPIFYECQRCTACCRWPGQVRVSDAEITGPAAFKGISERDFIQQFTRLRSDRRGLALAERPNGERLFLEGTNMALWSNWLSFDGTGQQLLFTDPAALLAPQRFYRLQYQ